MRSRRLGGDIGRRPRCSFPKLQLRSGRGPARRIPRSPPGSSSPGRYVRDLPTEQFAPAIGRVIKSPASARPTTMAARSRGARQPVGQVVDPVERHDCTLPGRRALDVIVPIEPPNRPSRLILSRGATGGTGVSGKFATGPPLGLGVCGPGRVGLIWRRRSHSESADPLLNETDVEPSMTIPQSGYELTNRPRPPARRDVDRPSPFLWSPSLATGSAWGDRFARSATILLCVLHGSGIWVGMGGREGIRRLADPPGSTTASTFIRASSPAISS